MTIQVRYIDTGKYIIGNEEYGYTLCVVNFNLAIVERFTEEQLQIILNDFKESLIERLNLEGTES